MTDYKTLFREEMNSGDLRKIFICELQKCKTQDEKRALLDVYNPIEGIVLQRELNESIEEGILTSY